MFMREIKCQKVKSHMQFRLSSSPPRCPTARNEMYAPPGIHPRLKQPVGQRLALGALHAAYGKGSGAVGGAERDGDRAVDSVLLLAARERPAGEHTRTRKQPQQPPVSDRTPELQWRVPFTFSVSIQFSDLVQ